MKSSRSEPSGGVIRVLEQELGSNAHGWRFHYVADGVVGGSFAKDMSVDCAIKSIETLGLVGLKSSSTSGLLDQVFQGLQFQSTCLKWMGRSI